MLRNTVAQDSPTVVRGDPATVLDAGYYFAVDINAARSGALEVVERPVVVFGGSEKELLDSLPDDDMVLGVRALSVSSLAKLLGEPEFVFTSDPALAREAYLLNLTTFLWTPRGPVFLPPPTVFVGGVRTELTTAYRYVPGLPKIGDFSVAYGPMRFDGRDEVDVAGYVEFVLRLANEMGANLLRTSLVAYGTMYLQTLYRLAQANKLLRVVFGGNEFLVPVKTPPKGDILSSTYDEEEMISVIDSYIDLSDYANLLKDGILKVIALIHPNKWASDYITYLRDAATRIAAVRARVRHTPVMPELSVADIKEFISLIGSDTLRSVEEATATNISRTSIPVIVSDKGGVKKYVVVRDGATYAATSVRFGEAEPLPDNISGFREFDDAYRSYVGASDEVVEKAIETARNGALSLAKVIGVEPRKLYVYALLGKAVALAEISSAQ